MAAIFKVALTGGPGGGKSSSLVRLRRELGPQGFQVQPFSSGRRGY
jgi:nucleoside-triphosphatase THEP1